MPSPRAVLSALSILALVAVSATAARCGGTSGDGASIVPRAGPAPVPQDQAKAIDLSTEPFAEIELPPASRPGGAVPPERLPLQGPWRYAGAGKSGMHKWAMDVPIRPRSLFFHNPQPGMAVYDPSGAELAYDRGGEDQPAWSYNRKKLTVYLPEKGTGPAPGAYTFSYPRAVEREKQLNFSMSGIPDAETFTRTSIFNDWDSREGLLVPAPGKVAWDLEVPAAAELLMTPGIAEPEILDPTGSDGARLVVEVEVGGKAEVAWSGDLKVATFDQVRVDLSKWSGQKVRLRMRSEAGGSADWDYVFIGQPVIASRSENPRRVVMVFIDTLRTDHMSLYGYDQRTTRKTTEKLDEWAKGAVVFDQARSVAPWTLPSARTIVTGRHPEYYSVADTVQSKLADEGFLTAMFAGNVYLSSNFEMHRDWGLHRVGLFPSAEDVTKDALAFLDQTDGHDAMMQVHYMDAHLPYKEPANYRFLFAGDPKGGLGEKFELSDIRAKVTKQTFDPDVAQYVVDRYDNNIRYITDQLATLLARLDDNDVVLVYADHGEEFWDHGGFEHGHTLFDELLHVPLMIKAPGLAPRRVDTPVSLLDVTPTVLDALGLPTDGMDGVSLLPVARGEAEADAALRGRDLAFGRPLYGTERWGVLHAGKEKWMTNEGRESLYDIAADAKEQTNLIANKEGSHGAPYHEHFARAIGAPVRVGYRLFTTNSRGRPDEDLVAVMKVPGGVASAWVAHDPLMTSSAEVTWDEETGEVTATWKAGFFGGRDIYVIPKLPIEEVTRGLEVAVTQGDFAGGFKVHPEKEPGLGKHRTPLGRVVVDNPNRTLGLGFVITPEFPGDAEGVGGNDPEMKEMLEAMGYVIDGDEKPKGKKPRGDGGAAPGVAPSKDGG